MEWIATVVSVVVVADVVVVAATAAACGPRSGHPQFPFKKNCNAVSEFLGLSIMEMMEIPAWLTGTCKWSWPEFVVLGKFISVGDGSELQSGGSGWFPQHFRNTVAILPLLLH